MKGRALEPCGSTIPVFTWGLYMESWSLYIEGRALYIFGSTLYMKS